ncbi:MAG: hypothetical protein V2A64_01640 [Candidatus Omnitrophota bacterium]
MKVEPFLISSSLLGVLAQRLIRKVCGKCREFFKPTDEVLKELGLDDKIGQNIMFTRGKGCIVCNQSGYKGRIGIFEFLKVTPGIQELVLKKASADAIRNSAIKEGMTTLRSAALDKLIAGLTTIDEVFRVTLESGE